MFLPVITAEIWCSFASGVALHLQCGLGLFSVSASWEASEYAQEQFRHHAAAGKGTSAAVPCNSCLTQPAVALTASAYKTWGSMLSFMVAALSKAPSADAHTALMKADCTSCTFLGILSIAAQGP